MFVRFIGFPTGDPAGGEAEWAGQSLEDLIALALSKAEGWQAPLPALIIPRSYRAAGLGLYDRTPINTWHRGRVVLCGDSAHPVTPIGGQVKWQSCSFHITDAFAGVPNCYRVCCHTRSFTR